MRKVYIFVGSIIVGDNWWKWVAGSIVGIVGVGYVVLEYIPSIEPPTNMRFAKLGRTSRFHVANDSRDADANWGAEQI